MRFVFAIVTFVVAAVLIGLGAAQRTIWVPPANIVAQTTVAGDTPYIVIPGSVLNANSGQQTLSVAGSDKPFVAYGRTADVLAWIGDQKYARVSYTAGGTMTSKVVTPTSTATPGTSTPSTSAPSTSTSTPAPSGTAAPSTSSATAAPAEATNPVGSDLWLEQFVGEDAATTRMNVPDSVSVIIASDGVKPAPQKIALVWPLDTGTPWAGPLIVAGGALLVLGLVLYIFALRQLRRSRGPRRSSGTGGGPKMPKPPKPVAYKPTKEMESGNHGRRAIGKSMVAVPVVLAGTLLFSGCSAEYWPSFGASNASAPTSTPTPLATDLPGQGKDTPPPAVTQPQLAQIVGRVSAVATEADAKLSTTLAKTRFSGPALLERSVNYTIRAKNSKAAAPQMIPASPIMVGLPQATSGWPRTVSAVVQNAKDAKAAPIDLVMVQNTPRENYSVQYAIVLEAKAKVPDLPPTNIGASLVQPNSQLLRLAPDQVAQAYGDVLTKGAKSKYYDMFDATTDDLRKQVGAENAATLNAQFKSKEQKASFTFSEQAGTGDPIALATNKSGAIVSTSLNEVNAVKPTAAGANVTVLAGSAANILTGSTSSVKGLQTTYGMQLLFYVPPADSNEQIRLLGFTVSVVGAKDLAK